MFRRNSLVAGSVLLFAVVGWRHGNARPEPVGKLVIVQAVDVSPTLFKFEPETVTVQVGDTVRFVQQSVAPHNVEFTDVPAGSKLGRARVGPYLLSRLQKYDIVIDARFTAGTYTYQCAPHASLGMVGSIIVTESK